MTLSVLDKALWAADPIVHVALLITLLTRKTLKGFPVFISYLFYEVLVTVALFMVLKYGTKHEYFLLYWISGFAGYPLQILIILEVARDVLRPVGWWVRESYRSLLAWGTLGLLATVAVSLGTGPAGAKGFDLWENRESIVASIVACGLIVSISIIANFLHVPQRRHAKAIGNGLFVWSYTILLHDLAHMFFGWQRDLSLIAHIRLGLYLAVFVYWMVAFWEPEKEQPPLPPEAMAYVVALHNQVKYDLDNLDGPRQ